MKWVALLLILLIATTVFAFRIPRPPLLSHPLDQQQINQLNDSLENIWNLQNGEFNLDIVTTTKSGADEGDFWIFNDGGTYKLEFFAGGSVRTITP